MSKQVIDEEYVAALSNTELRAMYTTNNLDPPQYPLAATNDEILNEIAKKKYPSLIHSWQDHDSLLEPQFEDSLSSKEKEKAWKIFQTLLGREAVEKPKKRLITHQFNDPHCGFHSLKS